MALFSHRIESKRKQQQQQDQLSQEIHQDEQLREELSGLVAVGAPEKVTEALSEAEEAVSRATKLDIYGIKLMEHGRCPECRSRTENFLYTTVCPSCGWFRRRVPDTGRCVIHLEDGEKIECDRVYGVEGNQFLCVTNGVVHQQVMVRAIRRIEYVWTDEEMAQAQEQALKQIGGVCSWCEKPLAEADPEGPYVDYVAFGVMQERYVFCSTKCMRQFRNHSPSRIHRNCYETDCNRCEKCIKRYDVSGFKRMVLT